MRTEFDKIKVGDLVAEVMFSKVIRVSELGGSIVVKNVDSGQEYSIVGRDLVETVWSADAFDSTEKVTLTEMAGHLVVAFNKPFTVRFKKANGSDRVLRGRLVSAEHLLGRVLVEDLDVASGSPLRQVDLRTIYELILGGVRYVLK